ncbi:YitT family protein [Mycoplasma sp. Ms02]|uniref:YitT family protein n=1 Tax=Mycoplasma sp. Ms02 TaxID=353851 RepID=UPI001C891E38|nr:YitT family protein [Mycoplasma sp. Ms02]QZE12569.1 YitT family protein [Mycoplasma sp. Ms02]
MNQTNLNNDKPVLDTCCAGKKGYYDHKKYKLKFLNRQGPLFVHQPSCPKYTIKEEIIDVKASLINYKMGEHLLNNSDATLTFTSFLKRYGLRILAIFIASIIFNFGVQVFLIRSETVPSGLTGIPVLINLLSPATKPYSAAIYLLVNIPLIVTFGIRIKRSFTLLSVLFMLFQNLTIFIFIKFPWVQIEPGESAVYDHWTFVFNLVQKNWNALPNEYAKNPETWPILLYGAIGAVFVGAGVGITWKAGGSTGGTDFIAYYFSTKTKKSVGSVLNVISIIGALTFLVILKTYKLTHEKEFLEEARKYNPEWQMPIIGMSEISTLAYILINNTVVNLIYPKYKKVKMTISCADPTNILAYLRLINYWHGYEVIEMTSGYTGKKIYRIESVMLFLETKNLMLDIKKVDPNSFISITPINVVKGNFNTDFVEN